MAKDRREELAALFENVEARDIVLPLIEDVVFLEGQLNDLRKLPFIRVNPSNKAQQKPTIAAKQYKELLQQYNNCVKTLASVLRRDAAEEESPLREFLKMASGNDR